MKGYLNNTEETKRFFYRDDYGIIWGRTGDLGYIDTDGKVTLLSRKKQMIVRPDGHNVFPIEIEEVLREHTAVNDVVVLGLADKKLEDGCWATAFVELKDGTERGKSKIMNELYELCVKKLPERDRPRKDDFILVKKVIHTAEGKVDEKATSALANRLAK